MKPWHALVLLATLAFVPLFFFSGYLALANYFPIPVPDLTRSEWAIIDFVWWGSLLVVFADAFFARRQERRKERTRREGP
jgi:hypothetical protein